MFWRLELLRLFLCLAEGLLFLLDLRGDDFPGLSAIDYFFGIDWFSSFSFLFLSSAAAVWAPVQPILSIKLLIYWNGVNKDNHILIAIMLLLMLVTVDGDKRVWLLSISLDKSCIRASDLLSSSLLPQVLLTDCIRVSVIAKLWVLPSQANCSSRVVFRVCRASAARLSFS